jgi:hypothetical protein
MVRKKVSYILHVANRIQECNQFHYLPSTNHNRGDVQADLVDDVHVEVPRVIPGDDPRDVANHVEKASDGDEYDEDEPSPGRGVGGSIRQETKSSEHKEEGIGTNGRSVPIK